MAELLKKIPAETRWAITAQVLTRFIISRSLRTGAPLLGKGEGITLLLTGREKLNEIQEGTWGKGGTLRLPWVKETFNIPVEDAIGAANVVKVAATLLAGPEYEIEIVEAIPERVVIRRPQCPWWNRHNELASDLALRVCESGHIGWTEEGLKELNPKLTYKLTKALPWGDPYCEEVIEFKEE